MILITITTDRLDAEQHAAVTTIGGFVLSHGDDRVGDGPRTSSFDIEVDDDGDVTAATAELRAEVERLGIRLRATWQHNGTEPATQVFGS
jgi:hypothetical protein